ncbi:MAG: IS110 family transposase, partial [Gemmatimonadales bacterium]
MKIVAIDLGKGKSVACVYSRTAESIMRGTAADRRFVTLPTRPREVHDLIAAEAPDRVVIEIGPPAGWVCDLCRKMGVQVQVANPNHEAWRWKNVKKKTDRDDAEKLARLSESGDLPLVHVPEPEVRARRELIAYRHSLVRRMTAIKNSIRAILTRQALAWPKGKCGWTDRAVKELKELAAGGEDLWRRMLGEELGLMSTLGSSIASVEKRLDELGEASDQVKLVRTIPGVGPRLAEVIVATLDKPERFKTGRQVGCYAGLTPRIFQSGSMDRQGKISGQGPTLLRSLLVEVSWLGRRWNPWMDRVYQNALRGSKARKKIAITALARRLLVVAWAMLRDNKPWNGPARTDGKRRVKEETPGTGQTPARPVMPVC